MIDALEGYKAEIVPEMKATLEWNRDLVFTSTTQRGYDLEFDANNEWGCMPLEAMLMSLAGCMAIDVVSILEKMRVEPESFRMEIAAERAPTPPQRLTKIRMDLHLTGNELPREKVERAVALSEERYCSVRHTMKDDIEYVTEIHLNRPSV